MDCISQLRHLFQEQLGISPSDLIKYHKALFAKKLLTNKMLSVTEVAFAAGFGSVRQFNDVFKSVFHMTPMESRKSIKLYNNEGKGILVKIPFKLPFDFQQILGFMTLRGIVGVESVVEEKYFRTFWIDRASGYFFISCNDESNCLDVEVHTDQITCLMKLIGRIKGMFDIGRDFEHINQLFEKDPLLVKGMVSGSVPRLPRAFDPFEHTIRAVLGQQITVKAATTLAGRIVERVALKTPEDYPQGLDYYFPSAEELLNVDLSEIGITNTRQRTIEAVVKAIVEKKVSLSLNQSFDHFYNDFIQVKGIGSWTVNYVAMRGLGMVDAFPAKDLGVLKALNMDTKKPKEKEVLAIGEKWRPYRSYATLCLWHGLVDKE